jgi:hypothetical protein
VPRFRRLHEWSGLTSAWAHRRLELASDIRDGDIHRHIHTFAARTFPSRPIRAAAMQPTAPLLRQIRRLALTTKQGPHNYYKGNRTGAMGRHTKYGGYKIDWSKVRTYVCPDLSGFHVRPLFQCMSHVGSRRANGC